MNTTLTTRMTAALEYYGRQATGDLDVAGPVATPLVGTRVALIRRGLLTAGTTHHLTDLGWVELESRGTLSMGYSGFTHLDSPMGVTVRIDGRNERVSLFATDVRRVRGVENRLAIRRRNGNTAIVPESAMI